MRYAIMGTVVLAACLVAGWALAHVVAKRTQRVWPLPARILLSLLFAALLGGGCSLAYVSRYYHADDAARAALSGTNAVRVTREDASYLFDGPGEDALMVFLPGAKVACEAYTPLMLRLAERGIDCELVDPPAHLAPLGLAALDRLTAGHPANHIVFAGHSLGGYVAASYVSSHAEAVDALVLLAAYPGKPLPKDVRPLSVFGSEDGVLEMGQYEDGRAYWPPASTELVLAGGNHAGFGNYGAQAGDGTAQISCLEQQEQTAQAICELIDGLEEDA